MSQLVKYAVRSGILLEDSLVVLDVAGEVTVKKIRAEGLNLEARALAWAIRAASAAGLCDVQVPISPSLHALASSQVEVSEADGPLWNLRQILRHSPFEVVVAEPDERLVELARSQPLLSGSWELDPDDAAWAEAHGATVVFTDGSSTANRVGAWAWYVDESLYAAGPVEHVATGLTAERRAVAEALAAIPGPVLVLSDHERVMESFDAFLDALSIPDPIDALERSAPVRVSHVKGHADCVQNLRADRLAHRAVTERLAELEVDVDLAILHEAAAAEVTARLSERQEFRRARERWCKVRRRELITERHPDWDSLSKAERKLLGNEIHVQATGEYNQLHGSLESLV